MESGIQEEDVGHSSSRRAGERRDSITLTLPAGVNLQEVSTHLFFVDERVNLLNSIYCDLIAKGTGSEYFGQVIQFLLG